jgi:L-fucose mutarotase/ribose pyranase (RbsD/FucU family)
MTKLSIHEMRLPELSDALESHAEDGGGKEVWLIVGDRNLLDQAVKGQIADAHGFPIVNLNKSISERVTEQDDYEQLVMSERATGDPKHIRQRISDAIESILEDRFESSPLVMLERFEVALRYDFDLIPALQSIAQNEKKAVVLADATVEGQHIYVNGTELETTPFTTVIQVKK